MTDPHAAERSGLEIAVIGMALRVPGASTVEKFWTNLRDGVESITRFTPDELRAAGVPEELIADPRYVPAAGVIDDHDLFDAAFFGYTPREAEVMDPQHRAFLECAWEAVEAAGIDPSRTRQRIGVFAGSGMSAYLLRNLGSASGATTSRIHRMLGNDKDHVGTRVSYKLDLHGPGVTVQTACSTSLVAAHLACQSLIAGECDVALAGGVSVTLPHRAGYVWEEQGIYSPDGHCRAFDAESGGTVGGSGAAIVVLKSLEAALADGDEIWAILPGSAINNDGSAKVGYTAPSVEGQSRVIRAALAAAEVDPRLVGYVETHGTGTKLGDPIEVAALNKAFRGGAGPRTCAIGSLKTNVGHLDCGAGAAALIKTVLAVKHGMIPPSLHFRSPNPEIPFGDGPFHVAGELLEWPDRGGPRTAGVSSFGMGGTNAHVIVQQAPAAKPADPGRSREVLTLSARTPAALDAVAGRLADHLEAVAGADAAAALSDAAHTLQERRRHLPHRRAVVAGSVAETVAALRAGDPRKAVTAQHEGGARPVVFLFPGQGAQYANMGRGLHDADSAYRAALDECCELLRAETGWELREILFPPPGDDAAVAAATARLTRTEVTQPALFAVEYATAKAWMAQGVRPASMIGHSVGEYVAACLAGVFTLKEGIALIAERGRLMQSLPEGEMSAVALPAEEVGPLLPDGVSVATINETSRCVVSGRAEAVAALEEELARRGVTTTRLHTSHAFHSAMMDPILEPFRDRVAQVALKGPEIPFVSNLTGTWITPEQATDPAYWVRHLRNAVQFARGLGEILKEKRLVLLETGPGRTLTTFAGRHPDRTKEHVPVTSIRHPKDAADDHAFFLQALGKLWISGADVDWKKHRAGERRRLAALPAYPWERKRYWVEPGRDAAAAAPRGKIADVGRWFWVEGWKRLPGASAGDTTPADGSAAPGRPWLVLGEAGLLSGNLERELGVRNEVVAADPADVRATIARLGEEGRLPGVIVHLGDSSREEDPDPVGAVQTLLDVLQALDATGSEEPVRLFVVTRGAADVTGSEPLRPGAAAALGLAKVVTAEMPHVSCRCVDLADASPETASRLAREVTAAGDEPLVALRGKRRWAPVYEPATVRPAPERPARLRDGGVYVITGGSGAVGLEVAAYLASAARAKVVLLSRSGSADAAQLQRIAAAGGEAMTIAADVTDRAATAAAFAQARERFGAVHGVFHAAGADKDMTPLRTASRADVEKVLAPKRDGMAVLAEILRDSPPDFCMVLSSLSSVLGAVGYGGYTAAHAYLDTAVAALDRESAFPWIAVDWDNWITWRTRDAMDDARNVFFMTPEEAADALGRALGHEADRRLIVSTGDLRARVEEWVRAGVAGEDEAGDEESLYERPELQTEFAEPTTEAERALAGIWSKQLGIEKVGIHDDYFELGGDSVIAIQVVSEAAKAGLRFTPADIFAHPTVAELAASTGEPAAEAGEVEKPGAAGDASAPAPEQDPVVGEVPLTPIQRWFFDRRLPAEHRFNLPVLVDAPDGLDESRLREVLKALAAHHDTLRMRYRRAPDGTVTQTADPPETDVPAETVDLTRVPPEGLDAAIRDHADRAQGGLDLENGPLMRAVLFRCGEERPNQLLLVAHHLLLDVVSWRILLEDFGTVHRALRDGKAPRLPARTTSFRQWAHVLREWAGSPAIAADRDWWRAALRRDAAPLPLDHSASPEANREGTAETVERELSEASTAALQAALPGLGGARFADALLTALARTLAGWTGARTVAVDLELHGREAIVPGIDLSRTVGWFTSLFPVYLEGGGDLRADLATTASTLKDIPRRGVAHGALRWLAGDESVRAELASAPPAEVGFLYLGQSRRAAPGGGETTWRPADLGYSAAPEQPRSHKLQVVVQVRDGRLWTEWIYSTALHREETVARLADGFLATLGDIAGLAGGTAPAAAAPEDFPAARIASKDLEALMKRLGGKGKG